MLTWGREDSKYQKKTRGHLWRTPDWLASTGLAWPLSVPWCHEAYLIPEHHLMIAVNGYFSTLKKTCIELMMIVNGGSGGEPRNYEWRNRSWYFFLSWGCLGIHDVNLLLLPLSETICFVCCLNIVSFLEQACLRDHLYITFLSTFLVFWQV